MINKIMTFLSHRHKAGGLLGPDPKDERDLLASTFLPQQDIDELPNIFNLRDQMTPIKCQLYGSCTSHSVCGVSEYLNKKEIGKDEVQSNRFIYHNTKVISGLWNDEGDYSRNAVKSHNQYGVPLEEDFPDTPDIPWITYVKKKPSQEAYDKALAYKSNGYLRVDNNLQAFRNSLYQNKTPVACGMSWSKSMNKPDANGKLPLPSNTSEGHAISFVGWENDKNWFRNSWGPGWGNNGYFYILTNEFIKYNFWDGWILFDLPNNWIDEVKSMHQRYIAQNTKEQYFKHNDIYWRIPDADTLHYLLERQWVTNNMLDLPNNITVQDMPLSKKAFDYIKQGKVIFDDIFIKN